MARMTEQERATKAQATEILNQFHRFMRLSGYSWRETRYSNCWELDKFPINSERTESLPTPLARVAPYEVDAIITAINGIEDIRSRGALVLKFIALPRLNASEQGERLQVSESELYRSRAKGVFEFARLYRGGIIEQGGNVEKC